MAPSLLNPLFGLTPPKGATPPFLAAGDVPLNGAPPPDPSTLTLPQQGGAAPAGPMPPPPLVTQSQQPAATPSTTTAPQASQIPPLPQYDATWENQLTQLEKDAATAAQYKPSIWRRIVGGAIAGLGGYAAATSGPNGQFNERAWENAHNAGQRIMYGPRDQKVAQITAQENAARTGMTEEDKRYQQALQGWEYQQRAQEMADNLARQSKTDAEREADRATAEKDRVTAQQNTQNNRADLLKFHQDEETDREKDRNATLRATEGARTDARQMRQDDTVATMKTRADAWQASELDKAEQQVRADYGIKRTLNRTNNQIEELGWTPGAQADLESRKQKIYGQYSSMINEIPGQKAAVPTNAPATPPSGGAQTMVFPDGKRKLVPAAQVDQFTKLGGRVVQ